MAGPSDEGAPARDEGAPARASLREAIAALQNLHALVRSPRVGPKAIAPLVPELVALLGPLGEQLARGLGLVEAPPAHLAARAELVAFGRALAASALAALERAAGRGVDARSRLGLELELERLLPPLEGMRELVDALEASRDEGAAELDLRDLLDDAFAPASPAPAWGRAVPVRLAGPPPAAPIRLRPRAGRALLAGAVGWVGRAPAGAGGEGGPAVLVRARLVGPRAYLELAAAPGGAGEGGEGWLVQAGAPIGPAPGALAWVAARSGARARFLRDRPAAALLLPTWAPG
ncbi:MAG TPA: hypothetical protein VFS43_22635 [Polyangiaceae bacterium]|nr:hypothetical protein [Polyangiaceae bacterium]